MAKHENRVTVRDGDIVNIGGTKYLAKNRNGESCMDFIELKSEQEASNGAHMPKDLTCPVCGETQRMQSNAKYCSNKCRQKQFRDNKKQESDK